MPMPGWLSKALLVDYRRFLPVRVQEKRFGWVRPDFAQVLARFPDVFHVEPERVAVRDVLDTPQQRSDAIRRTLETLRAEGVIGGWRNEDYEVFADASGEPLFRVERAAVKHFGIRGRATHVNGLVDTPHGVQMWVARRAETKATDPGKLDNLVGGGIAWGLDAVGDAHQGGARGSGRPGVSGAGGQAARHAHLRLPGARRARCQRGRGV